MNKRQRLVMSVGCGVAAMIVVALYAGHVRAEASRAQSAALERYGGEVVQVVVASRTMEAGEVVSGSDVSLVDWVSSLAPPDVERALEDVIGREVSVPVGKGVPLTKLNFRDADQLGDIPAGHVAVSVPITEKLGVASGIPAGAHVVGYRVEEGSARLIVKDALVMASPAAASLSSRGSLTIAVPANNVSAVLAASTAGDLRLVVPADDVRARDVEPEEEVDVSPVLPEDEGHE